MFSVTLLTDSIFWVQMVDTDSDVQIAVAELERKFVRSFAKVHALIFVEQIFVVPEQLTTALNKHARLLSLSLSLSLSLM
jgi:hypothetical protein